MSLLKMKSTSVRSCGDLQKYLERDNRAAEKSYSDNILERDDWGKEMDTMRAAYEKRQGRKYYHIIQSYEQETNKENYNPKKINELGSKLAKMITHGGDYQYAVITHADTDNLHNHIVISSTDLQTGKKLHMTHERIKDIHLANNLLSKRAGLHTLTETTRLKHQKELAKGLQPTIRKTDEIYLVKRGNSYKEKMREGLQRVFSRSDIYSGDDFRRALAAENIKISRVTGTGNITYQDADGHKARATRLGAYNKSDAISLMRANKEQQRKKELQQLQRLEKSLKKSLDRSIGHDGSRGGFEL